MRAIAAAMLPACYLAASWTWVIGMWLPVYLTADFGWPAFVVFAVPNVVGATLVGFAFRPRSSDRAPAQRFIDGHRVAIHWFSFVTVCLHLFFCGVLARGQLAELPIAPLGGVSAGMLGVVVLSIIIALMPMRVALVASCGVILASCGLAMAAARATGNAQSFALPPLRGDFTQASFSPLILTAPAIWLGFLACPHLDATILRIRRDARDPQGLYAFVLGFSGLFLLMILMTLGYAGSSSYAKEGLMSPYIVLHILVQAAFTMGVHARAMVKGGALRKVDPRTGASRPARRRIACAVFALALMPMLGTAARDMHLPFERAGYPAERVMYDTFMAAYAIVFPAYLWICAVPGTPAARCGQRARLMGCAIACAIALPCLALGVFGPFDWAIPIGVGVVVAMPWLLFRARPGAGVERAKEPEIA